MPTVKSMIKAISEGKLSPDYGAQLLLEQEDHKEPDGDECTCKEDKKDPKCPVCNKDKKDEE